MEQLLLARKGTYHRNGTEILFQCAHHNDNNPSCTYNLATGLYQCFSCGAKGNKFMLAKQLNSPVTLVHNQSTPSNDWPVVSQDYLDKTKEALKSKQGERALAYLQKRGFNIETIERFNLGYDHTHNMLAIPSFWNGRLSAIKFRFLDKHTTDSEKYSNAKKGVATLFNYTPEMLNAKAVCIYEGELDCISHYTLGLEIPAVALPGKDTFKKEWVSLFSGIETIYLCLDNEAKAEDSTSKIAELLGSYRCHIVKLPPKYKDLNDLLCDKNTTYPTILSQAERVGKDLVRSLESFENIALETYEKGLGQGISTGMPLLDELFGGFRMGELVVLSGFAGCGKTTLALSAALNVARENEFKVLCGMFENHTAAETMPVLASLHEHRNLLINRVPLDEYQSILRSVNCKQNIMILDRFSSTNLEEIDAAIRISHKRGAKFIVLDHLHFLLANSHELERVNLAMKKFASLCHDLSICILLLVQPSKPGRESYVECPYTGKMMPQLRMQSLKGSGAIYENAHAILLIQQDGKGQYVEAAKIRSGATLSKPGEKKVRLGFDKGRYAYDLSDYVVPPPKGFNRPDYLS